MDENGEPLSGVTLKVTDSNKGAVTRDNGTFEINVDVQETLVISYIGFITQSIKVVNDKPLKIVMKEDTKYLNEVVVVGYGEFRREDLTGSLGELNIEDVIKAPVPSFDQALAGRIAGVMVTSNDAQPGNEMNIIIRGANSLTQDNSPLYVIDGFPMEDFSNASLNPADIASLTVLKDASATAIYGARGANGVIIIETKKGKMGKPVVTYNGSYGFQEATKTMDMMNPYDFVSYQLDRDKYNRNYDMEKLYLTDAGYTLEDYKNMENIDWQKKLFRMAPITLQSLSITGGTEQTRYLISGSYAGQDGVIENSGYNKYQGRIRLEQTLNKKLKIGLNINYTQDRNYGQIASEQQQGARYFTYLMYQTWAYRPVKIGLGDIENDLFDGDDTNAIMNPIVSNKNQVRKQKRTFTTANLNIDYAILPNLRLNIKGGYSDRKIIDEEFNNSKTYKGYPSANNLNGVNASYQTQNLYNWMNENTLTFKETFNKDHKLDITAGATINGFNGSLYGLRTIQIPNEDMGMSGLDQGIPYATNARLNENILLSFLGRVNYNYKSRYLLTFSMRADGSSKFDKDNRWGYFPSGAFAWTVNRESFMKDLKFISNLKFRASYGMTGNNRVNDNARYSSVDIGDYYSFNNGTPSYALTITNLGNKKLKWEKTEQIDLGIDISLFRNRINLVIDAYQKTTKDLLLNSKLPYTSGTRTSFRNIGKIRNQGLEFTLNTVNIQNKDFTWESSFNIAFMKSKVLALADGEQSILSTVSWTGDWNSSHLYITKVDEPVTAFYGYVWDGCYQIEDFTWQNNSDQNIPYDQRNFVLKNNVPTNGDTRTSIRPGDAKYIDQNRDGIINDADRVVIGNPMPIHIGGFNNNFTYKDFGLNIFFQWSYGNDVFNANRIIFEGNPNNRMINQYASYTRRWSPDNPTNEMHRIGSKGLVGVYSSRTVEDGSYLRLKTVQLSYNIPQKISKKISIDRIQLYVSAQNLFTWTDYSGMDPEVSVRHSTLTPGFDYSSYARNRTITFGTNITF